MNWLDEFILWNNFLLETLGDNYNLEFAAEQWKLFWSGVRDGRLHDCCIWLIDRYGYKTKTYTFEADLTDENY